VRLLKEEVHQDAQVACIGRSGEKLSLISCIIGNKSRAAGRSGLGALMGSKNLKALAVRGTRNIGVTDEGKVEALNNYVKEKLGKRPFWLSDVVLRMLLLYFPLIAKLRWPFPIPPSVLARIFAKYGTCGGTAALTTMQESPIKNWKGTSKDFPRRSKASLISNGNVVKYEKEKYGCAGCPIECGGVVELGTGKYALNEPSRKPEYETLASFGSLLLNSDVESIIRASDICNRYGLDTISAGSAIAFATECYEAGLIGKEETGIELKWGDPNGILTMLLKIAEREGFGDVLADGLAVAAAKIGKGSDKYAMHIAGQSLPMHDPKNAPGFGATYVLDPTPGRHTAGGAGLADCGMGSRVIPISTVAKHAYERKGRPHVLASNLHQVINCAGVCLFVPTLMSKYPLAELIRAATGWDVTMDELLKTGERIQMLRHCFNLREGFKPGDFELPSRVAGEPPLPEGPLKGRKIDVAAMRRSCLKEMGLNEASGKPSPEKISQLGLEDLVQL
jgi:aldehyde:ferredoxin oxidoreductase